MISVGREQKIKTRRKQRHGEIISYTKVIIHIL